MAALLSPKCSTGRPLYRITDPVRRSVVCDRAQLADTSFTRLFGLLGRGSLEEGEGLLIRPSSGVHTFGMTFPIDLVALDQYSRVCGLKAHTPPWRVGALGWRVRSVLELPAGRISRTGLALEDVLIVQRSREE